MDASSHDFTLTFSQESFPPVKAFWSITMYTIDGDKRLFYDNSLDRYSLGTSQFGNEPGEVTIYISHLPPDNGNEDNWLPAPDGKFNLYLRLYLMEEDRIPLENSIDPWAPPPLLAVAN